MAVGHLDTRDVGLIPDLQVRISALSEELDEGDRPPTSAAQSQCAALLRGASGATLAELPPPLISTMGDGDLMLEWKNAGRRLLLFLLPSGSSRLQEVTGQGESVRVKEVARNPSSLELTGSIRWLIEGRPGPV